MALYSIVIDKKHRFILILIPTLWHQIISVITSQLNPILMALIYLLILISKIVLRQILFIPTICPYIKTLLMELLYSLLMALLLIFCIYEPDKINKTAAPKERRFNLFICGNISD